MLVIRDDQWSAFEDDTANRFVDRLCAAAQVAWEAECARLGPEGIRARVELAVKKAAEHGIADQNNVTRFVHLFFLLDRDDIDTAEETAWVATILGWPEASEVLKLAALEKRAQAWAEEQANV